MKLSIQERLKDLRVKRGLSETKHHPNADFADLRKPTGTFFQRPGG